MLRSLSISLAFSRVPVELTLVYQMAGGESRLPTAKRSNDPS